MALTPTRPTFFRLPAPAMPCTTTQNTIGAISTLISLMKASPSGFRLVANDGKNTPSATPTTSAITTWPKMVLKNLGTAPSLADDCRRHHVLARPRTSRPDAARAGFTSAEVRRDFAAGGL